MRCDEYVGDLHDVSAALRVSETAGGCAEYDVDEKNDGQDPGGKYDSEYDTMSMSTILVTLFIRKKNLRPDARAASRCTRRSGRSGRTLAGHIPLPM